MAYTKPETIADIEQVYLFAGINNTLKNIKADIQSIRNRLEHDDTWKAGFREGLDATACQRNK
jgi:hypothetical protein